MESIEQIQTELRNTNNFESPSQINEKKFQIVNQVGLIYAIGVAITFQFGNIYYDIFYKYFPHFFRIYKSDSILLITFLSIHLTGVPLIFILTKFIKKTEIQKNKYGCKKYFATFLIMSTLSISAALVESLIEGLFFLIFKKKTDNKITIFKLLYYETKKTQDYPNIYLLFFVVCFTGPIAEEIIFRKFLIDRLALYSKTLAIFSSGIMFGIFHSNFRQLFPAILSGWALAYSYAETGNLFIPISYHIYWNTTVTVFVSSIDLEGKKPVPKYLIIFSLIKIIEIITGFILLIIYRKKIKVTGEENKSKDKWKFFKSYGMWIFILEGFMLFCIFYSSKLFVSDLLL